MRHIATIIVLLALLLTSGSAAAQPTLVVSTDTLYFPAEITFAVTNAGADSLSLSFPVTYDDGILVLNGTTGDGEPGIPSWDFEVETPDSLYGSVHLPYAYGEPPTIPLGPSASAAFRITGWDSCPICRGQQWGRADTLYIQGTDATGSDTARVILDLSGVVSAEPAAPASGTLRLNVYPNPVRHALTVAVASEHAADVDLLLVDALGREVRRLEGVSATGQAFSLDVSGLPSGAYVLRARATDPSPSGFGTAGRPFVIVQ